MDARKDRIGEHAAEHALPWAVTALGPVPEHPLDRLDWQRRASSIGAWRELSGYDHPDRARSAPNPPRPPRTCGPPGTRPSPPSAPSTAPTCAACPTGRCCTCATPTRSKPPGRRSGSATSSARSAPAPGDARLAGLRAAAEAHAAQPPRPPRPSRPAAGRWPPATRPCTTPTGSARPSSPPSWPTGPTGSTPPASNATWPSPPTPNCAAATPASSSPRCAPPNPSPPPTAQRDELTLTAGAASRRDGPVDQGPGRRAPHVRRPARRPAEPDDPVRGPRLRRPRPGVPRLDRTRPGRDPAAAQARDPAVRRGSCSAPPDRDADREAAD